MQEGVFYWETGHEDRLEKGNDEVTLHIRGGRIFSFAKPGLQLDLKDDADNLTAEKQTFDWLSGRRRKHRR
jgi:hypothetical protein